MPASEIAWFYLIACNGDQEEMTDACFDHARWTIRHLVIDTGGWLSGRQVLKYCFRHWRQISSACKLCGAGYAYRPGILAADLTDRLVPSTGTRQVIKSTIA